MTIPDFKNVEDLTAYLANQEKRIQDLEQANAVLIAEVKKRFIHKDDMPEILSDAIPRTGLLNRNFLKRAFTVWGHYFVAQLIIGLVLGAGYFVYFLILIKK